MKLNFTDTKGNWHFCPAGGCDLPKQSVEKINEYWLKGWIEPFRKGQVHDFFNSPEHLERYKLMSQYFEAGRGIVDEFGEILPEFDLRINK